MARGWESKAVEAQQDDRRRSSDASRPGSAGDADRERGSRRRVLELARARAAADLAKATAPAQREMLTRALVDLDRAIAGLDVSPS